jgi:predicted ATPase/DNA-binding winged helix-turn-helix (wHTH) protein
MQRREVVCFGPFQLDLESERLWQGATAIPLRPKTFAVLRYLAEHPNRLVTKDEILQAVWSGIVVSESVLMVCLSELRKALGDQAQTPHYIETVPRRGYRFIATISRPTPWTPAVPLDPPPVPAGSLMVGRQGELAQLHGWWQEACRGARRVVFVTGEPGIGKTTVVNAFVAQATAQGEVWSGRGQCIEHHGAGEAYLPVLDTLARLCRQPQGERVQAVLQQYAPTWLMQMPWVLSAAEQTALARRVLGSTRERMLRELAEAVEALSRERALLLVLEDLHWSDAATVDLLAWLARRLEPGRLLLIGTYRPVDVILSGHPLRAVQQELARQRCCIELEIELLTAAEVAQYLSARFAAEVPQGPSLQELAMVIHQRTDGHPLFMVTLVDDLLQRGWLAAVAEQGQTAMAAIARELPDSLRQMIEQQREGLKVDDQRVLEAASVAGSEFSTAAVAAGLASDVAAVEARCADLARRRHFLQRIGIEEWPDGTVAERYRFRHGLYQQVVYEGLTAGSRIQWHRRIGHRLEEGYGAQAGERAAELAGHFEWGRDYPRAVRYRRQAAENALQRYAYREAAEHLTTALTLLATLPETPERIRQELDLQIALGPVFINTKGRTSPDVERTYTRARDLCQSVGETRQLFPVLTGLWVSHLERVKLQMAQTLGAQLLDIAQRLQEPALLLEAHLYSAITAYYLGEFAVARAHLEQGLTPYTPEERFQAVLQPLQGLMGNPMALCLSYTAAVLELLGYPEQALQQSQDLVHRCQHVAHPYTVVYMLLSAGWLRQRCRDVRATQALAETIIALAAKEGFITRGAAARIMRGWALAMQGQSAEGITQLHEAMTAYQAAGGRIARSYHLGLLAEAYSQGGQREEGLAALSEALALVETTGVRYYEAELYRLKGELLCLSNAQCPMQHAQIEAEACFHRALDMARRQQAKSFELRAALSLGRLWQRQGRREAAQQLVAEVYAWFTEGFETRDLREARAFLDALS